MCRAFSSLRHCIRSFSESWLKGAGLAPCKARSYWHEQKNNAAHRWTALLISDWLNVIAFRLRPSVHHLRRRSVRRRRRRRRSPSAHHCCPKNYGMTEPSKTAPHSRAKKKERNSPGTTARPSSFGKRAQDCFDTRAANRNCGPENYRSVNYNEASFRRTSRSHTNSARSSSASCSGCRIRSRHTEPISPGRLAAARNSNSRVRFLESHNRGSMRPALTSFPTMDAIATSRCCPRAYSEAVEVHNGQTRNSPVPPTVGSSR